MTFTGFKAGTITLDEPRLIYYSGQVLSGTIQFELGDQLTFTDIKVVYIGQAIVKWSENEVQKYSGTSRVRQIDFSGRDVYFSTEQLLCGGPTTLPAGSHSFKFSYQIPPSAPSSFKGSKGSINYRVVAVMEHQDMKRDELSSDFEVVAPLDLNTVEDIKKPIVLEFEDVSSCNCFCQDSVISVKIVLPVSGYCPGQMMQIKIDSKNYSSVEVRKIVFQFVKRERYHSEQPKSTYTPPEEILETLVQGPILANTKRSFTFQMRVPDIIAYNLEACNIIDVAYFLKVKVKMSGCAEDLEDECELCIGLIPLKETVEGTYIHPLSYLLPKAAPPNINNISNIPIQLQNVNQTPYPQCGSSSKVQMPFTQGYKPQNVMNSPVPYEIGFKVPDIVVEPPYPINDGNMPQANNFPKPSAPPM
ncbi:arrestin domain-containing protein 1-like [Pieris napi]|uniref:arrestin domain-containing protein 1-like n=1 Tax=Pieris napi TaxID=78633 RepID=UPI001FBB9AAA|nr:arrestin domain-containing protein 1-like [Pieris napi]